MASTFIAIAIIFVSGMNLGLPALGWATPIQVARGVFVDDVLVALYLILLAATGATDVLFADSRARRFAWMIVALAAFGIISAGVNAVRIFDMGQALHLVLFAALFLLAVAWTRRYGVTFVLRWYLIGLAFGGAINLYMTVAYPKRVFGFLPVLYLQNGAGGALAIGVGLGAWLMMTRQDRLDKPAALAAAAVGLTASAVSWSKTAMSICAFGMLAWGALVLRAARGRPGRMIVPTIAVVGLTAIAYSRLPKLNDVAATLVEAVTIKFSGISVNDKYSVGSRYMYFFGVADIVSRHPFVGVSYGGFYEAMIRTPAYESGNAVDEDPELGALGSSNPHNTFLYYASANGIPGFLVSVAMFLLLFWYMWLTLEPYGWTGRAVCVCVALGYFIFANTLPTLYATGIFHIPGGVILGRLGLMRPPPIYARRMVESPEVSLA